MNPAKLSIQRSRIATDRIHTTEAHLSSTNVVVIQGQLTKLLQHWPLMTKPHAVKRCVLLPGDNACLLLLLLLLLV